MLTEQECKARAIEAITKHRRQTLRSLESNILANCPTADLDEIDGFLREAEQSFDFALREVFRFIESAYHPDRHHAR
jgi:hypothetical protein